MMVECSSPELKLIADVVAASQVVTIRYRGRLYRYIVNPISTGLTVIEPKVLRAIVKAILDRVDIRDVDYILTFEAMGIHIATALSLEVNIPVVIAKKRDYTGNMIPIYRGEGAETLYLHPEIRGSKVIIVDSIISNGTTISRAIKVLEENNVTIKDIIVVIERLDREGVKKVKNETGYDVKSLVKISVSDKVEIVSC